MELLRKKVINSHYYDTFNKFRDAVLDFFNKTSEFKTEIKQFVGNKMHLLETV